MLGPAPAGTGSLESSKQPLPEEGTQWNHLSRTGNCLTLSLGTPQSISCSHTCRTSPNTSSTQGRAFLPQKNNTNKQTPSHPFSLGKKIPPTPGNAHLASTQPNISAATAVPGLFIGFTTPGRESPALSLITGNLSS